MEALQFALTLEEVIVVLLEEQGFVTVVQRSGGLRRVLKEGHIVVFEFAGLLA